MTETLAAAPDSSQRSLVSRLVGVVFSPRDTFAAIVGRPRALGALVVCGLVFVAAQTAFMSTDAGRDIVLDQQVRMMESFGMTITDEAYAAMEAQLDRALYINPVVTLVSLPIVNALVAGLLLVVFTMLLGGSGTFKQLNAVVAHAGVVIAIQQLFVTPLSYASGRMGGANLGVFVPMLEERSFFALFLGMIDLFWIWWMVVLAIGIGVLYKRRTGPVATGLISLYVVVVLLLALVRS